MRKISKQHAIVAITTALFVFFLAACSATRQVAPYAIGLQPLQAYDFIGSEPAADTVYRIIRSEAEFNESFRTANTSARRPGFSGQTVVAILLKQMPATPLHFTKADVAGTTIHVYAQPCSSNSCGNSRAVLATIPHVGSARSIQFFVGGENKAVVSL